MQRLPTNRNQPHVDNHIPDDHHHPGLTDYDEETANFSLGNSFQPNVYDGIPAQSWMQWDAAATATNANTSWVPPVATGFMPYSQPYQQQVQAPLYQPQYTTTYAVPVGNHVNHHYQQQLMREQSYSPHPHYQPQSYVQPQLQPEIPFQSYSPVPFVDHATPRPQYKAPVQRVPPPTSQPMHDFVHYPINQHHHVALPIRQSTPATVSHMTPEPDAGFSFINSFIEPTDSIHSHPVQLNWSPSAADDVLESRELTPALPPQNIKRKFTASPSPAIKQEPKPEKKANQQKELSDFLVVFENAPGALASVKKRKKLDEPVRKAAKDVRKAGACHQCRFRKRTCGTGTPCSTCLKQGSSMCELRCQRESPFIGKFMSRYFEYSSNKRVTNFGVAFSNLEGDGLFEIINIDGVARLSHPLTLRARRQALSSFVDEDRDAVITTRAPSKDKSPQSHSDHDSHEVLLLEDKKTIGDEVEQWAMEYTSKYIHAAGPDFYPTTIAQIMGTAYVKKGLPESPLVAAMLRVAALAFVLRAGVKYSMPNASSTLPSPTFRTVQARIDSILYSRLKLAERDLFARLQILIFRTAGCLGRDQIYPVALVMFQLMRFLSLAASHVSNLAERFGISENSAAQHMHHCQRLLLSVHLALFRSSTPLLLDFRLPESSPTPSSDESVSGSPAPIPEPSVKRPKVAKTSSSSNKNDDKDREQRDRSARNFNRALLNDDDELCRLAMKMRKVILDFRKKGLKKEMKGSITWRPEVWELFRGVYDGL